MTKFEEQFQRELELVSEARMTEKGERALISYLQPLLESAGREFLEETCKKHDLALTEEEAERALLAGFFHIRLASKTYLERVETFTSHPEDCCTFTAYFTWFLKQGIWEHIQNYHL